LREPFSGQTTSGNSYCGQLTLQWKISVFHVRLIKPTFFQFLRRYLMGESLGGGGANCLLPIVTTRTKKKRPNLGGMDAFSPEFRGSVLSV
jgi:hypothetical protein